MKSKSDTVSFAVVATKFRNVGMQITRLDWIIKYVRYGATFKLVREPDNKHDPNAIKIRHVLKSGKEMTVGYMPNNERRQLADEIAPLMDKKGFDPLVMLSQKIIQREDSKKTDAKAGDTTGLVVRFKLSDPSN